MQRQVALGKVGQSSTASGSTREDGEPDRADAPRLGPGEILASLPYGVVVVDGDGAVVQSNPAAGALVGGKVPDRCDQILDCRGPNGPCEHGCLVRRAALAAEPLPEIRVDAASESPTGALWVTASPLEGGRCLLHLRAGAAGDRRRRTDHHWLVGPQLQVRALGRTRIDSVEGVLGGRWLQQRAGQVFKLLVAERRRILHAEQIAEALWPNTASGVPNVRYSMHVLRSRLEPGRPKGAPSSFVVTAGAGYALNRRAVTVDADEFATAARDGLEAIEAGDTDLGCQRLRTAIDLYAGDFMTDEPYAEWAVPERDRLRDLAERSLRALADFCLTRGDLADGVLLLERLADMDPYDADVQRRLLAGLLSDGRRGHAVRRYAAYRQRLVHDLAREPDFTLTDLGAADLGPNRR